MIASRLRLIAYGVAIAAVLGVLWHVRSQGQIITTLRVQVGELEASNATRAAERDQCLASVEIQNAAIADLRARGEAAQRRADAARAEADRIGAQTQRRVQQAMAAAVPAECPAAMQWLGEQGRALAREWETNRHRRRQGRRRPPSPVAKQRARGRSKSIRCGPTCSTILACLPSSDRSRFAPTRMAPRPAC